MKLTDIELTPDELQQIECKVDQKTLEYGGDMPAHNKTVYRNMLIRHAKEENLFWMREAVRRDSKTGPDDQ